MEPCRDEAVRALASLQVTLPSEVQFVEASGSGTESGGVVSWTLGPVSSGFNGTEVITVQANSGLATGTLLNIEAELDPGNTGESPATLLRTIPVHPEEALRVTLSASDVPTVRDTRVRILRSRSRTLRRVPSKALVSDSCSQTFLTTLTMPARVILRMCLALVLCDDGEFLTWTP